jgi:hypothetical protein
MLDAPYNKATTAPAGCGQARSAVEVVKPPVLERLDAVELRLDGLNQEYNNTLFHQPNSITDRLSRLEAALGLR